MIDLQIEMSKKIEDHGERRSFLDTLTTSQRNYLPLLVAKLEVAQSQKPKPDDELGSQIL